jgi:hypothetical protein
MSPPEFATSPNFLHKAQQRNLNTSCLYYEDEIFLFLLTLLEAKSLIIASTFISSNLSFSMNKVARWVSLSCDIGDLK